MSNVDAGYKNFLGISFLSVSPVKGNDMKREVCVYMGRKREGVGVGTHHLMDHYMFCLGKRENLLLLEHKDKYQKIQAHQHKGVEPKRIERLGFCVEDDSMYENGAGVYDRDGREAYGA